jgi:glutaredoxin
MAVIRWVLGRIILLLNWVFSPRGIKRTPLEQKLVDEKTKDLVLYQYEACPFCVKVRREMKRKTINIELRDAKRNEQYKKELEEKGGRLQVPCLKLTENGQDRWLYESGEIIQFLQQRVV